MDEPVNSFEIHVNIQPGDVVGEYIWTYKGHNCEVDRVTGNFKLPACGRTAITYQLDHESRKTYQLLYVNIDPQPCATSQIEAVQASKSKHAVTLIDRNDNGPTGSNPFSLRLLARLIDNIESGFLSPDPQVINSPNPPCP